LSGIATRTAAAAAADSGVISTEEALRQHKDWLVNFRRNMNLTSVISAGQQLQSSADAHTIATN